MPAKVIPTASRPRHEVYDELLRYQADLSFDLESPFYRSSPAWQRAQTVLDFGSGNAYYTSRLAQRYPNKEFLVVERDPHLLALAQKYISGLRIQTNCGTYTDVPASKKFDFVLARHALSYISEREEFFDWVCRSTTATAGVLVIDANDDTFLVSPTLPILQSGNEDFKKGVREGGGNRNVVLEAKLALARRGFIPQHKYEMIVHSDISDRKYLMYMFMKSVAEFDHGSPLPQPVRDEVDRWAADPTSYLQFGLIGSLFERAH